MRILASTTGLQLQAGLFDGEETQDGTCAGGCEERTGQRSLDPAVWRGWRDEEGPTRDEREGPVGTEEGPVH